MIEIELKSLISKENYESILKHFKIKEEDKKLQINYYFDTVDLKYIKNKEIVRIREKENSYELTIKQKGKNKYINEETNKKITKEEFKNYLENGIKINKDHLVYISKLKTIRVEFKYKSGLLAIDANEYCDLLDYEIEYEVSDLEEGKREFYDLLNQLNILQGDFLRKSERLIKRLNLLTN